MTGRTIDWHRLWRRFLVLCCLTAAAVAAPLLDLYGKNPEVFVANRSSKLQIVLFALLVTLVPAIVATLIVMLAEWIGPRIGDYAYRTVVAMLGAAIGLVIARQVLPDSSYGALAIAIAASAFIVFLFDRLESTLALFAFILPVVLVMFVGFSGTSRLIWEGTATAAEPNSHVGSPSSIVMIQLDEFPEASLMDEDGSINEALFPNFARLASDGTWYRNAFSASIATTQSVPSIVTGKLGSNELSPTAADHPESLFTLLGSEYEMHVIEWVADLCPETVCEDYAGRAPARFSSLLADVGVVYGHLTLPESAREGLPNIDNSWKGFLGQAEDPSAGAVSIEGQPVPKAGVRSPWIDWMQRIINGITPEMPPTLSYAHLTAPHVPWRINPSGTHYQRPEEYSEVDGVQGSGFWVDNPEIPRLGFQRHLYQLGFLDDMLGSLFAKLDETGMWDDTMIIVVADHGASFVAGQHRRWPYEDNRDDLYRVPLFVKYPHQETGEIRDEPAFTIDILPTIVDSLDIDTAWTFDGMSLLDIEGTDREHEVIYWCCSREPVSTDISILYDQVERNHEWIPDQSSWLGIASAGPFGEYVGMTVDELDPVPSDEVQWQFDYGGALAEIDRDSGMVQTLVTGRLELPEGDDEDDFLIAVNGTIAGTGFLSRDTANAGQIRGLIDEEMLLDGHNEVTLIVPDPDGTGWLTGSEADLALVFEADDGHLLELQAEGSRRIQIDKAEHTEDGWLLEGWAADVTRKLVPDRFYVFAGNTLVAVGPPNKDNTNVVRWYASDDLLHSGFSFVVPDEDIPEGADRVMVVAEFDDYVIGDPAILEE